MRPRFDMQLEELNNDLTEILYSTNDTITSVPSDKRIVTGANIYTADDSAEIEFLVDSGSTYYSTISKLKTY